MGNQTVTHGCIRENFTKNTSKKSVLGTKEAAQQLSALAALAEDLGTAPSTHVAAHNHL